MARCGSARGFRCIRNKMWDFTLLSRSARQRTSPLFSFRCLELQNGIAAASACARSILLRNTARRRALARLRHPTAPGPKPVARRAASPLGNSVTDSAAAAAAVAADADADAVSVARIASAAQRRVRRRSSARSRDDSVAEDRLGRRLGSGRRDASGGAAHFTCRHRQWRYGHRL
eukprot:366230-Chlamydomonas_euryale.AAC.20